MGAYLSTKGWHVEVVTAYPYYPQWKIADGYRKYWFSREKMNGATVTRCPLYVPSRPTGIKRMLQDASFFTSSLISVTRLRIKGLKAKHVFVASPSLFSGWVGVWYSKVLYPRARMVYHIQDLQVDAAEELGMIKQKFVLRLLKWVEKSILRSTDIVSSISPKMLEKLAAKKVTFKQPPALFPNWSSSENLFPKIPDKNIISQLGIPAEKKMIFYSGAMGEKQGLEMVLNIAESVQEKMPCLFFVLAGQGPYAERLKSLSNQMQLKNVLFIPLQPLDIFNELLNHASLHLIIQKGTAADLLLPSKLTNILGVGGLAMVTAEKGTSLYEEIDQHQMGILIPPADEQAFLAVLQKVVSDDTLLKAIRSNALDYSQKYLKQKEIIENFWFNI